MNSFQYIKRRPHVILGLVNPFTAKWDLKEGVYTTGDLYTNLKSTRWIFKNTEYGDEYLYELRKQDYFRQGYVTPEGVKNMSVAGQITSLMCWDDTRDMDKWNALYHLTIDIYDV